MASDNKWAYITGVIYNALNEEPGLVALRALNKNVQPSGNRIVVFSFVAGGVQTTNREDNRATEGTMTIRIWTDVAVALEGATPTGKSLAAYGAALSKIENCIAAIPVPQQETHNDGTTTIIYGINVALYGGHVDNGDTKIEADCDVTVNYATLR